MNGTFVSSTCSRGTVLALALAETPAPINGSAARVGHGRVERP